MCVRPKFCLVDTTYNQSSRYTSPYTLHQSSDPLSVTKTFYLLHHIFRNSSGPVVDMLKHVTQTAKRIGSKGPKGKAYNISGNDTSFALTHGDRVISFSRNLLRNDYVVEI